REVLPMPDVPERCPQCHSPVAERFPHAVMYDCGFTLFNDGEPVTDDYPAECQRRRIKRLEKQLAATRAKAERWRKKYEALRAGVERVADDLHMAADEAHDNWRITADFNEQGRSIGLEEAEQMVRRLLTEAGGGDQ